MNEQLTTFRADLERTGLRVVPHRDHLCVRLPLFASVRVRVDDGELRLLTQAGPTRPGRAITWTALGGTGIVGALAFTVGVGALTVTVGVGLLALLGAELGQLVLAESCATRLAIRWMMRREIAASNDAAFVQPR
jgi:hypothetical protein